MFLSEKFPSCTVLIGDSLATVLAIQKASSIGDLAMDLALPPDFTDPLGDVTSHKEVSEDLKKQGNKAGEVDLKRIDQSWVKAAQEKKKLKKYEVEVSNKEGIQMVEIPDEIIENSTPLWEDFVVGKFLDLDPHVAKVHMVLNKI